MGSNHMIAEPVVKVHTLANNPVAWTGSGSVYVMEEVEAALAAQLDQGPQPALTTPQPLLLRGKFKTAIVETMRKCYQSALSTVPFPPGQTATSFVADFLLVGFANGEPWFLEVATDGQINWHTSGRFYATGSGGQFATVCHALMRHYLEDDLSLDHGKLVAYRAIATTCQVSSGLVGLPVQMAVVDARGQRVLDDDEMKEVSTGVQRWMAIEAGTLRMNSLSAKEAAVGDLPAAASEEVP
jgi:proteasome beta subunit